MNPTTDEVLQHLMEQVLNLSPCPMVMSERTPSRPGVYANRAAVEYILPKIAPQDVVTNARLLMEQWELWQAGMCDNQGKPIAYEQRPGVKLLRGEEFAGQEIQWVHPINHLRYHVVTYGCLIPPNYGLVHFVDITPCVKHLEELNNALLAKEEFYREVSHEIRTPLTRLILHEQSLLRKVRKDHIPNPELVSRLESMEKSTLEMIKLVEVMFSKVSFTITLTSHKGKTQ